MTIQNNSPALAIQYTHSDNVEKKLSKGLQFTNLLGFKNQQKLIENTVLLHSLIELLIGKGIIHFHELEEKKQAVTASFKEKEESEPSVYLVDAADKYTSESAVSIDCESRYPICKAVCCKLWFALSVQDLDEGVVKWNYGRPYGIEQDADGFCTHCDRTTYRCKIYENRPLVCRTYDCSQDKRIWLDFENKIINPDLGI